MNDDNKREDNQREDSGDKPEKNRAFGVFKPVGYVVVSFPNEAQARDAASELANAGFAQAEVHHLTDRQMLEQIDEDLANASPLAAVGQELNLVKAHRELAERGYHWLVVRAGKDEQAEQVADVARRFGAERAQRYGRFIIEELIDAGTGMKQVAESPDRGLDAETPSGHEADRVDAQQNLPTSQDARSAR